MLCCTHRGTHHSVLDEVSNVTRFATCPTFESACAPDPTLVPLEGTVAPWAESVSATGKLAPVSAEAAGM